MSKTSFHRLRQLFDRLVDMPESEREAFLSRQTDLGEQTRRQLHGLLLADERVDGLDVRTALGEGAQALGQDQRWIGRRIGAFEIRQALGQGGMGSVWLAERVDGSVEQRVAIKVVRPDLLDSNTLARFRLERQLLALLQHPAIATMLDLGELDDGSPYAVMELVDGAPLDRYAREQQLALRPRLQLLLQICDAVSYAHRNMIVHRDLKPGNVLVDRSGRPKLLDFGIAKPLLNQVGRIDVEQTAAARRYVSLSHAAPEQLRGGAVGTACDVYGLGTLLYQLLAGVAPFVLGDRTPAQLEQEICETDPPPPSRRGNDAARGVALEIPRDLDLIALRCLRKRAEDRYPSVDALAEDLRRYLDGRPVLARRGNLLYRSARFVARHRVAVLLSTLLGTGLLVGSGLLWRQQRATAEQQTRADEMSGLIMSALRSAGPTATSGKDATAREVFERVAAQAQASPDLSPASRAHVLALIANIDLELGLPKQAQAVVAPLDVSALPAREQDEIALLRARIETALGNVDAARALLDAPLPAVADADLVARWKLAQSLAVYEQGELQQALALLETIDLKGTSADTQMNYKRRRARNLELLGRIDEALQQQTELLAEQRAALGELSPAVYDSLHQLTNMQLRHRTIENAEAASKQLFALADRMYSKTSLRYVPALSMGREIEIRRGNFAAAIALEQQIGAINRDQIGADSPNVARSEFNLGEIYFRSGDGENAEKHMLAALDLAERLWQPSDMNVALFRIVASSILVSRGKHAQAQAVIGRALRDIEAHPYMKEYEAHPICLFIDALSRYGTAPGENNRKALAAQLRNILDNEFSPDAQFWLERLIAVAKELGVEAAPPAASTPAAAAQAG